MHKDVSEIIQDSEFGPQSNTKWNFIAPVNTDYQVRNKLNKSLKYGRTIYVPYNRVIVISGNDTDSSNQSPVTDVFQFHLLSKKIEKLQPLSIGRTSFATHYDFEDRFIYVIGGCDKNDVMIKDCEKFDVFNNKWIPMPSMNQARGNPGTCISDDGRYLYAVQGFVNEMQTNFGSDQKISKALTSVERLDLHNEHLGWEEIEFSGL